MTDRLKGMKRILKVQDQLKRSADWRLAEAERAAQAIATAEAEVGAFLDRDDVTGALAILAVGRLRRLAAGHAAALQTVTVETGAMREATARQKLVAKSVAALAREEAALRERKDLERLIEGFVARGAAGETNGD